jgi:putative transposase
VCTAHQFVFENDFSYHSMPNYRRTYQAGGMFFFTLVTHLRRHLFSEPTALEYLREAMTQEKAQYPFDLTAIVLLPDHIHCIWELPENDNDFSKRWGRIKSRFTKTWLAQGGREVGISKARNNHRERGIWQKRFWEHRIRNEEDMMHHVNYIHYNPVKHGLVRCPHEWPYSSFARWVKQGFYKQNWLCDCEGKKPTVPEYLQATDAFGE